MKQEQGSGENFIMRSFMICIPHPLLYYIIFLKDLCKILVMVQVRTIKCS
jgi:hypothetical protein